MDYLQIKKSYNEHLDELYHFGIKGQRWGFRRFQNEDGSLTAEGEKRYYDESNATSSGRAEEPKKSKHRQKLEQHYLSKGYDKSRAEKMASNRIKTEVALGVVGAITIASAAAYGIYKHHKYVGDQVIKKSDSMQRIEGFKGNLKDQHKRELWDVSYVSNNKFDNKNYKDSYGYMLGYGKYKQQGHEGEVYKLGLKATKDLKVASPKSSLDSFKQLSGNKKFAKMFQNPEDIKNLTTTLHGKKTVSEKDVENFMKGNKISNSTAKKMYENFNASLTGKANSKQAEKARNMFYKNLKKNGYSGLVDVNDAKYSGLRSSNPLIFFNSKKDLKIDSVTDIKDNKNSSRIKAGISFMRTSSLDASHKYFTFVAPTLGAATAGASGGLLSYDYVKTNKKKKEGSK